MLFARSHSRHRRDKTAQLVDRVERLLESGEPRDARVIRVGKDSATNFFAPAVLAQPVDGDEWMPFGWTSFEVRMSLVIHVVQQTDRFPQVRIAAACRREMSHRVSHGVAMFAQTLRLDPLVQNDKGAISEQ